MKVLLPIPARWPVKERLNGWGSWIGGSKRCSGRVYAFDLAGEKREVGEEERRSAKRSGQSRAIRRDDPLFGSTLLNSERDPVT
jgi:hypothetical protein